MGFLDKLFGTSKKPAKSSSKLKSSRGAKRKPSKSTGKKKSSSKSTGQAKSSSVSRKKEYPHFRKHLKANHPALIVGEKDEREYNYRKVMHSDRDGRHLNETIYPNPNPKDPKPMNIAKRVRHADKNDFSKWKYPWEYPEK